MIKRKSLSQKTRFEVFKRDKFTCQYCGAKAPDVVLQVDHIEAVATGGTNDILNLLTSCKGCNGGKSATPISDGSAVERQRQQLADLEERRQQIELMVKWKTELSNQDDTLVNALEAEIRRRTGFSYSETGRARAKRNIKKLGFAAMFDAIDAACARYQRLDKDGNTTQDSAEKILKSLAFIASNGNDPDGDQFAYIQGIMRNRFGDRYLKAFDVLRHYRDEGLSVSLLADNAKAADDFEEFKSACAFDLDHERRRLGRG